MPQEARKELGARGETLAAELLLSKGFALLGRNVKVPLGEIDILMRDGETLVLVEVKSQTRASFIDPIHKIGPAKQRKLLQLGKLMSTRFPECNIRFDAVTLYWNPDSNEPVITHYENILI